MPGPLFQDEADFVPQRAPRFHPGLLPSPGLPAREDVLRYVSQALGGLPLQEIAANPQKARETYNALWQNLTHRERERLRPLEQQFFEQLSFAERRQAGLTDPRVQRAMQIQDEQGVLGKATETLGSLIGKIGAVPSMVPNALEMLGADDAASGIRKALYGDNVDTATAARRIRDTFRLAFDPSLKDALGGGEDMTQLLARATALDEEGRARGLPGMGLVEKYGETYLGAQGEALVGAQGLAAAGETAGDIGAFIVGAKGVGGVAKQTLGRTPGIAGAAERLARSPLSPLLTGAEFAAVDVLQNKSTEGAGESFLFGTGLGYAGKAAQAYGGRLIGRSEKGKRSLFGALSPEASRNVGIGVQGGNRYAVKPQFRGGVKGAAQRAAGRGIGETAKLTAASAATNITKAALSADFDSGDALMHTLHEIPGHLLFGAFTALGGNRDLRLPFETRKGGTDPTTADLKARRSRVLREVGSDLAAPARGARTLWQRLEADMEASFGGTLGGTSKRRPASAIERAKQRSSSPIAKVGQALERRWDAYRKAATVESTPAKVEREMLHELMRRAESARIDLQRELDKATEQEVAVRREMEARSEAAKGDVVLQQAELVKEADALYRRVYEESRLRGESEKDARWTAEWARVDAMPELQRRAEEGRAGGADPRLLEAVERRQSELAVNNSFGTREQLDRAMVRARRVLRIAEREGARSRAFELRAAVEDLRASLARMSPELLARTEYETIKALEAKASYFKRWEMEGWLESFGEKVEPGRDSELELFRKIEATGKLDGFYEWSRDYRAMATQRAQSAMASGKTPDVPKWLRDQAAVPGRVAQEMAKWRAGRGHVDPRMIGQVSTTPPLPGKRKKAKRPAKNPEISSATETPTGKDTPLPQRRELPERFDKEEAYRAEVDLRNAAKAVGGEEGEILSEVAGKLERARMSGKWPGKGALEQLWLEVRSEHERAREILAEQDRREAGQPEEPKGPEPVFEDEPGTVAPDRVRQPKPMRADLPKAERDAQLAKADLPKASELPAIEPVPGEVQRAGFERGAPIYLKSGAYKGSGRVLALNESTMEHWERWMRRNFPDAPREAAAEIIFRARLQAEGFPFDPRTAGTEHDNWIRLEAMAKRPLESYNDKLDAFRAEALKRYEPEMRAIVNELAADSAHSWLRFEQGHKRAGELRGHGEELVRALAIIRHGADIGMNFRDTYDGAVVRLASTAGPRGTVPKHQREWEAEEVLRQSLIESSVLTPEVWYRIEAADAAMNEARVGEWRESTLGDWLDKGFEVRHRAPEFPWARLRNQRDAERSREGHGEQTDASGEAMTEAQRRAQTSSATEVAEGETGPRITRPKGSEIKPVAEDLARKMDLVVLYHSEPIGIAPKMEGQRIPVLEAQRNFAERMVKEGLAERVAAEDHYTLTAEGVRILNDYDRFLVRRGESNRVADKHPWFNSPANPWSIRCLSPCGQSDGLERVVREGGEKGLPEGDVVGASMGLLPRIERWVKETYKEMKAAKGQSMIEASLEELGAAPKELKPEAQGWISTMVRKLTQTLADMPGGKQTQFAAQKVWTRLLTWEAYASKRISDAWQGEQENVPILMGELKPDARTEQIVDAIERWGSLSPTERVAWLKGPDAERLMSLKSALDGLRPEIANHLYRKLLDATAIAKARKVPLSQVTPISLRDALKSIGKLESMDGRPLGWTRQMLTPLETEYAFLERVARLKGELEPGASTTIPLPTGDGAIVVTGWGIKDYFPHTWAGSSLNPVRDHEFLGMLGDNAPTLAPDGTQTTVSRLRLANHYSNSDIVPAFARQKVARNLWKREQGNEGYIKHPIAVMLYLREARNKLAYEQTMEAGEEALLGRYEKLSTSSPQAMMKDLLQHHVPDVRQTHSAMAGHVVASNMLIEAKGDLYLQEKRKPGDARRKTRAIINRGDKFYWVKKASRLDSADAWKGFEKNAETGETSGDVLVLLPAGAENHPRNYIRLRQRGLERAELYVRKGGAVHGITGPVENTLIWQRLDELARNKGPRDLRKCTSWYCRVVEGTAAVLSGISHHAALGGVLNAPIALTNLVDAVALHNGAAAGVTTLPEQYRSLRPYMSAIVPNVKRYWDLKAEGLSDRDVYASLAREELQRNPGNTWAKDYLDIIMASPYDLGGTRESDVWANSVRSELDMKAAGEQPAWKRRLGEMTEQAKEFYEKHLEPKSFTSFDITEQYARQTLYITEYRNALKRYGLEAGKGNAPYRHSETGEYWRVEPGLGMRQHAEKRAGTLEDPHVMSAHAIAWNAVARTHFIYKLAYHPEVMRNPAWRFFGHLGTFGSLLMIERSKDIAGLGRVIAGKSTPKDRPIVARYVRHLVLGLALYELVDQLLGMDVGHVLGTHPADVPGLGSAIPQLNDLPNWVRFLPGSFPGGASTMPAKLLAGAAGIASGTAYETLSLGRSFQDSLGSQLDEWRSHNTSFWLPFEDPMLSLATAPLTVSMGRSLPARLFDVTQMRETGDPQKPLAFGPEVAPRTLSYETAIARAFIPGSPSEWTESYRKARSRRASTEALRAVRDQLAIRYFRAEDQGNQAIMRQVLFEAEGMGLGDMADSMKSRARTHGWSNAVRAYAGQDPLPVKLERAIADTESFSELERRKVHELIWGKQTPLTEINWRKYREFQRYPRMRDVVDRYRNTFAR